MISAESRDKLLHQEPLETPPVSLPSIDDIV